ncbi:uncharacterized protein LOC132726900 [Ruditapes philippinarum]|uniref:uncharacterized protein LOC132726900 n=1 Tax=Ruditapes philippinarum TaxID=129788 RepID=UPI00295AA9C3|nr:uncharacterized protein LOC132726900 [Ruditapes philippinarum]
MSAMLQEIFAFILIFTLYGLTYSNWQQCNGKCYYFGKNKMSFVEQKSYCNGIIKGVSRQADFGTSDSQTITSILSACHLSTIDQEPYWINMINLYGHPTCRTIVFTGKDVQVNGDVLCLSKMYSLCEITNTTLCQPTSNNTGKILTSKFVDLPEESKSYVLSSFQHSYCRAKELCESDWNNDISPVRQNNSFWAQLGIKLGLRGAMKLSFWIKSSGVSCLKTGELGNMIYYEGPLNFHMEQKSTNEFHQVLCVKNITVTTTTQKTTKAISTNDLHHHTSPSMIPALHETVESQTRIQTQTKVTSKQKPETPTTSINVLIPSSMQTKALATAKKQQYKTPTSSGSTGSLAPSTIRPHIISTNRLNAATITTLPTSMSTIGRSVLPSTSTFKQTKVKSTVLSATSVTTMHYMLFSKTTKASRNYPKSTGSHSMPVRESTIEQKTANGQSYEQSWISIGLEKYYVNHNQMTYKSASIFCGEIMNSTLVRFLNPLKYFKILGEINLPDNSFWVGAHGFDEGTLPTDCLSYWASNMTLMTSPCHFNMMSVCSKSLDESNVSHVLNNPDFKTMLREMSVLKNGTGRRVRKLTCAKDPRVSAKAAGFTGMFLICSLITLVVISDLLSLISSVKKR